MCNISNIVLKVDRESSSENKEFVKVMCRLYITQVERDMNMPFHVKAHLFEAGDEREYLLPSKEEIMEIQKEDPNYVGYLGFTAVRPDGNHYKDIELNRELDTVNMESDSDEYKVFIHDCPNNCTDFRWGRESHAD